MVAVVATSYSAAVKARDALKITWDLGPNADGQHRDDLRRLRRGRPLIPAPPSSGTRRDAGRCIAGRAPASRRRT